MNQTTLQTQTPYPQIDLSECLTDITANIIYDSEHYLLPSDIFEDAILGAINDLIDGLPIVPTSTSNRSI